MRFFYKIFLSTILILTVSLSTIEYLTVSYSLEHSVQREQDSALAQHQTVKYSIQTVLLNVEDGLDQENMENIGKTAAATLWAGCGLYFSQKGQACYYNSCEIEPTDSGNEVDKGQLGYEISIDMDGSRYLQVRSQFSQDGRDYLLITEKNVTGLFAEADALRKRCELFYWVILGAASVLLLLLSWTMTRPLAALRNTTWEFTSGDYGARAKVSTHDEVGDLARAFNRMARTIENKIEELKDAARRQEDFTANFAHELKTPMTSIIGYADTLYQKTLPPDQVHQLAGIIMNEGMRLEALSFKLLELITLERSDFQLEEARIDEVILDAAETARPAAVQRGITLECEVQTAWVRLEYDLFKTLLLNLMDNALKSGTDRIEVTGREMEDDYQICVTDYGRGIPQAELERITEAFYMVDKSRSRKEHGAGLGLALAARIARLHHTELSYDSTPGKGTTVSFLLKKEADDEEN